MDRNNAIKALSALAQATRLDALRLLVQAQPSTVAAGDVARLLDVPQNTMSSHLAVLERAGLISSERQGRSMQYRAEFGHLRDLVLYLVEDCCNGQPELCADLVAGLSPCCPPEKRVS